MTPLLLPLHIIPSKNNSMDQNTLYVIHAIASHGRIFKSAHEQASSHVDAARPALERFTSSSTTLSPLCKLGECVMVLRFHFFSSKFVISTSPNTSGHGSS
jgi:hypothetical protein